MSFLREILAVRLICKNNAKPGSVGTNNQRINKTSMGILK